MFREKEVAVRLAHCLRWSRLPFLLTAIDARRKSSQRSVAGFGLAIVNQQATKSSANLFGCWTLKFENHKGRIERGNRIIRNTPQDAEANGNTQQLLYTIQIQIAFANEATAVRFHRQDV